MAVKRSIPTRFFKDPDVINLSKDSQLILIGLCLSGDDYGRGVAHANLLGREMDYFPEQMEVALQELVANDLIVLYQAGRHRYYQLTQDWQEGLGAKRTPSKYPAPPDDLGADQGDVCAGSSDVCAGSSDVCAGSSDVCAGNSDVCAGNSAQYNLSKYNLSKEKEEEDRQPANVTPFPIPPNDGDGDHGLKEEQTRAKAREVATILQLPDTPALRRVVTDFLHDPTLSLTGEADAAREYIDDPSRNHRHKTMSLAFYRAWLKRERDTARAALTREATSRAGSAHEARAPTAPTQGTRSVPGGLARKSLMNLEAEYRHTEKSAPEAVSPSHQEKGGAHEEWP